MQASIPFTKVEFDKTKIAEFYPKVRQRVEEYFKTNNLSRHANGFMIFKTLFILSGFLACYFMILSNAFTPLMTLLLAGTLGFFTAMIGLNIGHDAIHGAFSSNATVNKYVGVLFNLAGANDYVWRIKHNIVHHTFTNIPEHDDDINQIFLLRIEPTQKRRWIHRFQHFYIFLLYPLASLSWVISKDYINFFRKNFGGFDNSNHPRKEYFRLFFYKAVYYIIYIVIPMLVVNVAWYYILLGFLVLHFVEGLTISIIFQLAHVVEGTAFPQPDETGKVEYSWAAHQMFTTADFARKSPVVNFLFGGLNFQIEHHLFPKVCHVHYKNISPIVQRTAMEYNLPYIDNNTFWGALASHVRLMRKFGRE